jgi:uncharacterized protein (TIGR02001 family)
MNTFKKTTLALAISALAGTAMGQSAPAPAPEPEKSPITANVTVVNDYRYRGMTQSNYKPAIQGGFDYAHESGFYIGNWNSSISWIGDTYQANNGTTNASAGTSAPIEMDFYAGFKKELIGAGFASDIGVLQYYYPMANAPRNACPTGSTNGTSRNTCGANPNTTELYVAQNFTFGPLTGFVKFSYALSNLFGINNSSGSYYPDLTVNYDTGVWGLALNGHIGYQYVAKNQAGYDFSYSDWKLGITKDFGGGLSGNISYVGTTNPKSGSSYLWTVPTSNGTSKSAGQGGGLISLTKTF